jgi:hypothetical protein
MSRGGRERASLTRTQHYSSVAQHLDPQNYRVAAEEAITRLSPDERAELAEHLRTQARQRT